MFTAACTIPTCNNSRHILSVCRRVGIEISIGIKVIIARTSLKGNDFRRHLVTTVLHYIGIKMLTVSCMPSHIRLETLLTGHKIIVGLDDTTVFTGECAFRISSRTNAIMDVRPLFGNQHGIFAVAEVILLHKDT